jgi:hypothetical protein
VSFFMMVATAACAPLACTLLTSLDGLTDGPEGGGGAIDGADEQAANHPDGTSPVDASLDGSAPTSRYAAAVLADEPLLYYRLREAAGAPARDEVSGTTVPYPITGVTYGAVGPPLAGDTATALTTTDGSGALKLGPTAEFAGVAEFSVEAWVDPSPTGSALGFLVDHEAWTDGRQGWVFRVGKEDVGLERWVTVDGGATGAAAGTGLAGAGQWHHVVGTFDGTSQRLYIDGVRSGSAGGGTPIPAIGVPFSVGKQNCSPCLSTGFIGAFGELAIYSKALAENRITAHFDASH